jgi:type II secretory pathway pseudopilin PulG
MMRRKAKQDGFSYIDVMIAIVILMVGVLGLVSALLANLVRSYESEKLIMAKQLALSTVESIISAKELKRDGVVDGWLSIRNVIEPAPVGEVNGIFLTGMNPVREDMGWDGVAGTVDDACVATGPCEVDGRTTNESEIIRGFEREIIIEDLLDPERPPPNPISRRTITVNVRYAVNQAVRTQSVSTILTNYDEATEDEP